MGAWGYGIFESDHDQDIVSDLGAEAGLDELEKALEQRIKDGNLTAEEKKLYVEEKLPPYYTLCGGGSAPEEIRQHLDSGVLEKLFAKKEHEMLHPSKHTWVPDYVFVLLGACAMTLGCRIPPHYKRQMQKHFLHVGMLECPERQMFEALNGPNGYQDGVPYSFNTPEDVTAAHEAEMTKRQADAKASGGIVSLNVPAPHGFWADPPKNKTLRATMDEGKYGSAACGGCGAEEKKDGGALLQCSRCKKRGYCGTECQREHWKVHKKMCVAAG